MLNKKIYDRYKGKRPVCLMASMALTRLLSAESIDKVFRDNAAEQYERKILFSALVNMMAEIVLRTAPSVNAAFKKHREELNASMMAVCRKLDRVEPKVTQALVRFSYQEAKAIGHHLRVYEKPLIRGLRTKILDGNHLAGTEHRLKVLRGLWGAALPGKSLVVLDPMLRLIQDMFPIEDGHAQERSALDLVIETIEENDLWIADRNFCTHKFLYTIDERRAKFVIRHHEQVQGTELSKRRYVGETERGKVYERTMTLAEHNGRQMEVRRIEIELFTPTRDGERVVVILTNLSPRQANALKIAAIYLNRWKIETAFQTLTTTLRCELNTHGYPRAALFAFGVALLAYNAVIVLEYVIQAEHGKEEAKMLSKYYMALEISQTIDGMMIALDDPEFIQFQRMSIAKFCKAIREVARQINMDYYRKNIRGPKKPPEKQPKNPKKIHVSTAKLLEAQRKMHV